MPITAEQLTVIRAGLDASAYQAGTNIILAANAALAASGDPVAASADKITRAQLGVERRMESYRRATIDGYAEISKFATIQDRLNRAMNLGRTTAAEATGILGVYAEKFGLVSSGARAASQAIQDVQIQSLAAADAMQRASQAQAAYNARSGSPGTSAPVAGAGYGSSASDGNPLYGDAYAARQADLEAYGAAMDSVRAKYVPMAAAQQSYEAGLTAITEAVNNGSISESEAAAARERVTQTYLDARDAINAYAIAQRDAAAAADQQSQGNAQAAYNARSGAMGSNPLYGAAYDARQSDISAAFTGADQQRASVDALYAASKRYESILEQIQALNRTGVFNDAQTEAAMKQATTNYANQADMAESLHLKLSQTNQTATKAGAGMHAFGNGSAFATRELIVMGDEVLRGNWTRIPGSMLVMTSHVAVLRNALVGLVTSAAGLAVIGGLVVTGGLIAFTAAAEANERQIEALRNKLSLVREDYVAAGDAALLAGAHMAKATGDSVADARVGTADLFANKSFQGSTQDAAVVTSTFYNLSKALGETQTDWKRMTEALNDPAAVLKSLQGEIAGINSTLITQVERLENSGDKAGAFAIVMQTLQDATKHVTANQSPLEEALRRVDSMFVTADGHGNTLTKTIGGFGEKAATGAVYFFGIVVGEIAKLDKAITDLNKPFEGFEKNVLTPLLSGLENILSPVERVAAALKTVQDALASIHGGTSATPPGAAPSTPGDVPHAGNIPTDASTLIYTQAEKLGVDAVVADFATRLAEQESGGHQWNADGSIKTSSTRALGMMQVEPDDRAHGTTKTIGGQTYDLMDTAQNVQASLLMIAESYRKHAGDLKEVASDYVGRGTSEKAVAERTKYLERLHLSGGEQYGPPAPPPGQAASDSSSGQGTYGVINRPQDVLGDALKLTGGTAASQADDLQQKINLLNKALAQTGNSSFDIARLTQELQKAQLEMYNAIPAAQGLFRAVDLQTTAEARLADATLHGSAAVERAAIATKAENEARTVAMPSTAQYTAAVAGLTAKYTALAAATQDVAVAQKTSVNQDTLEYLRAETSSYAMSDSERVVYLAHVKAEQEIKRTAPNADAAYRAGLLATTDAISKQTDALKNMGMTMEGGLIDAWKEITHSANDTGDAFKALATDGIKGAEDAFVKFVETGKLSMHDLLQSVETDLIKLAEKTLIEQPIMAALGNGGQGNLWSALFGGSSGGTATGSSTIGGSQTAGSTNGAGFLGPIGGLFGMLGKISGLSSLFSGTAAAGTALNGLSAADAAAFTGLGGSAFGATAELAAAPGGFLHAGGLVGPGMPTKTFDAGVFHGAPRFHDGLNSDEFAAVLQKGERVLTAKQDASVTGMVKGMANGASSGPSVTNVHHWNFPPGTNVDSFRRSQAQVSAMVARSTSFTANRRG